MYTNTKILHVKFITCFKMNILQIIFVSIFSNIFAAPQHPETNPGNHAEIPDQFEKQPEAVTTSPTTTQSARDHTTVNPDVSPETTATALEEIHDVTPTPKTVANFIIRNEEPPITTKFYSIVIVPIKRFINTPKVNTVLRNIGTCVVNGAMEIISHFFPTPLMPLIASAAGMIIPFEPVVLLKERMPVTSYRRAIKTAVNSFLDTFDQYKVDKDEDPYMTRQFYRRFMNDDNKQKRLIL
ncbi:uncharacterized protein LOC128681211 [Plodia interpunctella]|uniref:uncharacterized protein LOC128681211 n=1 Tax=Plodia interpunctella TaxID=58824 RepID=UPI0023678D0B|nr:uncharacterized protein LOC128681211 [Plodia interpunctella]